MNLTRLYQVTAVAIATMLVISLWGFARVGLDAPAPIHWGPTGEVDGYAPAWVAFLMTPVLTALIVALLAVVPRIEPRRENLRRSGDAYRTFSIALVLLMVVVHVGIVATGVTGSFPMPLVLGIGIGLLFAVMGNVLTTVRPNFMFGVRTPWTLASDRSWDHTHRVVGRLFVLTGIAMVVLSLTGEMLVVIGVMLAAIALIVVGGTWYSYRVWRDDPDRPGTTTMGSAS
ncbi:MAG TPA: SdpI family protein [Candidatus Limnocylindrales bacterium]|nr:SdpI family protein [Candidatus Limnocylindrales bacterium]